MTDTPTLDEVATEEQQESTAERSGNNSGNSDLPRAQLDTLSGSAKRPTGSDVGLDLILDVAVTVSLELGRSRMAIRELLQLNQGSVVEFDRRVGEPLNVLVNGTLLAQGELVVIDDRFGIRLTEVVSAAQRLEKLN